MPSRKRGSGARKGNSKWGKKRAGVKVGISSLGDVKNQDKVNVLTHRQNFRKALCNSSVQKPLNPFPASWRTTFSVELSGAIAAASGPAAYFLTQGNSPYLPFNTGTPWLTPLQAVGTVIPAGYGQLLAATGPYLSYRVYGSSISVQFAQSSASDAGLVVLAPYVGTVFASATHAAQSRFSKSKVCVSQEKMVISNAISTTEMSGDDPKSIEQTGFSALYNAYPTFNFLWAFFFSTGDAAVTAGNIDYQVKIVYDVVLENAQFDAILDVKQEDQRAWSLHQAKAEAKKKREAAWETQDADEAERKLAGDSAEDYKVVSSRSTSSSRGSDDGRQSGSSSANASGALASTSSRAKAFTFK